MATEDRNDKVNARPTAATTYATPERSDCFIFNLVRSHLVPSDEANEALKECSVVPTGDSVGRWTQRWIAEGRLTPWQIDSLSRGRSNFTYDRYRLVDFIGRGGMGSVFKAVDLLSGKFVALKFISDEYSCKKLAIARFSREVELMLKLDHPNIVRAYFAELDHPEPYFAMEYVAGDPIRSYLDALHELPVGFACECISQAAIGMHYAHEHGVIHRDLKPSNIMIAWGADGEGPITKVLDLGLTRLAERSGEEPAIGLTATGQCIGTPEYIAPEQAFNSKIADGRSDVFSLGCTLFHMLTYQLPYTGRSALEQVIARVDRVAHRVDAFRKDLPEGLADLVAKALERDPAMRMATLGEFSSLLSRYSPGRAQLAGFQKQLVVDAKSGAETEQTIYREPTPMPDDETAEERRSDPGAKILARLHGLVRARDEAADR